MQRFVDPVTLEKWKFNRQDSNGDGKISAAEYVKANREMESSIKHRPWLAKASA
jgi:Ca2+-binding EF-hand superfamily protein